MVCFVFHYNFGNNWRRRNLKTVLEIAEQDCCRALPFWNQFQLIMFYNVLNRITYFITGHGGRHEVFHHAFNSLVTPDYENQIFSSADVSSLYPYISMSNNFPTGVFTIQTQKKHALNNIYFDPVKKYHVLNGKKCCGLVLCRILAPKGLKEPYVQTIRLKDSVVIYGLCSACIQKSYTGICNHSDLERSQVETFCWPEVDFMVSSLNYKLMTVYECYQYDKEEPLFSGFIKTLAHGKLKHSISDSNEIPFINKHMKFPPILKLKEDEIDINPVRTSFYKNILVSFLGKLAQSNAKSKTVFVRNRNQ